AQRSDPRRQGALHRRLHDGGVSVRETSVSRRSTAARALRDDAEQLQPALPRGRAGNDSAVSRGRRRPHSLQPYRRWVACRKSPEGTPMPPRELDVLFTPLTINSLTVRNRFVMPGMQRGFMDDGAPTTKMVDYMRRCAAGGAGLIISESTSPDHPSAYWQPM